MTRTTSDLPEQKWVEKIDHLGIAVKSLEAAIPIYETLLGQKVEHLEDVPDQLVRTAFFSVGESNFELLEPMDGQGRSGDTWRRGVVVFITSVSR